MKKEQLTALGISEEQAGKVLELVKEETKEMIPKHRFDEVTQSKNTLQEQLKTANATIENLKKFEGTNQQLTEKIEKYQAEAKAKEAEYATNLKNLSKKNLIKVALLSMENRPYDVDIVSGLLDGEKILLDDKSEKILSGLTEQLENLRKEKPFLFSVGKGDPNPKGNPPPDGDGGNSGTDASIDFGKKLAQSKLRSMGIKKEDK